MSRGAPRRSRVANRPPGVAAAATLGAGPVIGVALSQASVSTAAALLGSGRRALARTIDTQILATADLVPTTIPTTGTSHDQQKNGNGGTKTDRYCFHKGPARTSPSPRYWKPTPRYVNFLGPLIKISDGDAASPNKTVSSDTYSPRLYRAHNAADGGLADYD